MFSSRLQLAKNGIEGLLPEGGMQRFVEKGHWQLSKSESGSESEPASWLGGRPVLSLYAF